MNTLRYFKTLEAKDRLRADKSEGLAASYPAAKMKISVGGHEIRNLVGQVRFGHPDEEHIAIMSFYAITDLNLDVVVDDRALGFGDTAVVITDGPRFIELLSRECERRSWKWQSGLVDYVDKDTHQGDMGAFRKYSDLSYQSEFRIAVRTGRGGPIEDLYLGDLSSLTETCEASELKEFIKIKKEA